MCLKSFNKLIFNKLNDSLYMYMKYMYVYRIGICTYLIQITIIITCSISCFNYFYYAIVKYTISFTVHQCALIYPIKFL